MEDDEKAPTNVEALSDDAMISVIEAAHISANNYKWGLMLCTSERKVDKDGSATITQEISEDGGSYEDALAAASTLNIELWSDPDMMTRDPRSVLAFAFPIPLFYRDILGFKTETEHGEDNEHGDDNESKAVVGGLNGGA